MMYKKKHKTFDVVGSKSNNLTDFYENVLIWNILFIAPSVSFPLFKHTFWSKRYFYNPKLQKNHFSKSPRQNISKLGPNNAHMTSLQCCHSLNESTFFICKLLYITGVYIDIYYICILYLSLFFHNNSCCRQILLIYYLHKFFLILRIVKSINTILPYKYRVFHLIVVKSKWL